MPQLFVLVCWLFSVQATRTCISGMGMLDRCCNTETEVADQTRYLNRYPLCGLYDPSDSSSRCYSCSYWFAGCLVSKRYASVSQGWVCNIAAATLRQKLLIKLAISTGTHYVGYMIPVIRVLGAIAVLVGLLVVQCPSNMKVNLRDGSGRSLLPH